MDTSEASFDEDEYDFNDAAVGVPETPLDTDLATQQMTSAVEDAENSTQEIFGIRISQTDKFKAELRDTDSSKQEEIEAFMDASLNIELTKQELWPVGGVQLLQECQDRKGKLLALENQTADEEIIGQLESQILNATDDEEQIIHEIVNRNLCAVEQQQKLKDLDEKHQKSIVELREEQHKTLLEHLKCNREETDKLLDEWADSGMLLLEQVEATKGNTLSVLSSASLMLEQLTLDLWQQEQKRKAMQEFMSEMAAMVMSFHQLEAPVQHSTSQGVSNQSSTGPGTCDCNVCFEELELGSNTNGKKRACFKPCNHATVCLDCAVRIWRDTKTCPMCKARLTTMPEVIHL